MVGCVYQLDTKCVITNDVMVVANKPKFLEAWQQKDNVLKDNYLQQCFIKWLKFIKDHDCGWVACGASTMNCK